MLAHQLNKKLADLRKDGTLWWARPDSKAQVRQGYNDHSKTNCASSQIKIHHHFANQ